MLLASFVEGFGLVKAAQLVIIAAVLISGCGDDASSSPTVADVVATVERFHPGATDVACTPSSGTNYACTAVVNGGKVTYRANTSPAGVYLNSPPGQ